MKSYLRKKKLLYPLALLMLILSVGWIISPAFVSTQAGVADGASGTGVASYPMSAPGGAVPGGSTAPQSAGVVSPSGAASGQAIVSYDVKHDTSPPLSSMVQLQSVPKRELENENEWMPPMRQAEKVKDPVLQDWFSPLVMPAPIVNFEGINFNQTFFIPPDTNGDVGPNHYVQWVNAHFAVYNKAGGLIFGPAQGNTIWSGFGGVCQSTNDGDPIVLYDPIADRWFFSQFSFTGPPYHQCIAVSTGPNPTGSYHRYDFVVGNLFPDYPKFGVWPDAYYMTANQFSGSFQGPGAFAFDRIRMLSGLSATMQKFDHTNSVLSSQYFGLLPSDQDGPTQPPVGSPNYIITWDGPFLNRLYMFKFHVDWVTPANSTMTGPTTLVTAAFNQLCAPSGSCISQPGTGQLLDSLEFDQMHRFAYRNFGTHESLVTNHSVDATGGNLAGVRWYELRAPNGGTFIFQQGTYSPDANHRWMGSIAMDASGDIAMGYSVSSGSTFPSIRYAGRLVGDPLGQMAQGEATLIAGGGSQTGGWCSPNCNRWGDYSAMSVDPVDDCTFWYTTEYIQSTGSGWRTRIGSFKFPSCTTGPTFTPTRTPTLTPTRTRTTTPTLTPTNTPFAADAFAHIEPAGPITITVGGRADLELWINSGSGVASAAQNFISFTNSLVQNVRWSLAGCVLTSTVTVDTSTFEVSLQNEICNGPATCIFRGVPHNPGWFSFASGTFVVPSPQGDFKVADMAWCGVAVGTAVLHWQFSPPDPSTRDTQIVDDNNNIVHNRNLYTDYVIHVVAASPTPTSTPTRTSTPIPTNTPSSVQLVGHVTMQGRPAQPHALQSVPVTLTLKSGVTELNYSTTTDQYGFFTVTVPSAGTYDWRVKNPQALANSGSVLLAGSLTQHEMGLLRVGDANNDNCVNITDFNILKTTFGLSSGDPGYDARADFDGNNTVSIVDFNLQRGTFGFCGANPIRPAP